MFPRVSQSFRRRSFIYLTVTLRTVAFWINTLLPVFWITIGSPVIPENEPSLIVFDPVLRWLATLFETVAVSC